MVGNGAAPRPTNGGDSGARREESVRRQQQLLMSMPKSYCEPSLASEVGICGCYDLHKYTNRYVVIFYVFSSWLF